MSASWPLFAQADAPRDAEAVRRAVETVFAREEFGRRESMLVRFLRWLGELLDLELEGAADDLLLVVSLVLSSVLVAALAVVVLRSRVAARRARVGGDGAGEGVDAQRRAADLRRRAEAARAAGDLRLALRLYFWALVVGLGALGDLDYRDAWTNRELLARGRPPAAIRDLLQPLVTDLEAKDFGREPTTEADVARLAALCRERLGPLGADAGRGEVAA